MFKFKQILVVLISFLLFLSAQTLACPKVNSNGTKYDDINCDRNLKLVFTGDSIVWGFGDDENEETSDDVKGYPLRIQRKFKKFDVTNLGVQGKTSFRLLQDFKQNLNKTEPGVTKQRSKRADAIIIAVGVNDYWEKQPLSYTIRNIRRLIKFLKRKIKYRKMATRVFVSTLLPVKPVNSVREKQNEFVKNLNAELLRNNSKSFPVILRLENVSNSIMGDDGLHPTSSGYDIIANRVSNFIKTTFRNTLRRVHSDKDRDRVYDFMETNVFGTDRKLKDTDGDGVSDGREIFKRKTDPLVPDN